MNKSLLALLFSLTSINSICQEPVVAVDGFLLKMNSKQVIEYMGFENIKDTSFIQPDSAKSLIGDFGVYGIFQIRSVDAMSYNSTSLRTEDKLLFKQTPVIYINDSVMIDFDLNSINPQKIDSIEVIAPLNAISKNGMDYSGGIVKIWKRE